MENIQFFFREIDLFYLCFFNFLDMDTLSTRKPHGEKGASDHEIHVHGNVKQTSAIIVETKVISHLCIGQKVRKAEQKVGQPEYC